MDALLTIEDFVAEQFKHDTPYVVTLAKVAASLQNKLVRDRPYYEKVLLVGDLWQKGQGVAEITEVSVQGILLYARGTIEHYGFHGKEEVIRRALHNPDGKRTVVVAVNESVADTCEQVLNSLDYMVTRV